MSYARQRILIACEFTATVRNAFRRRGHDAWSCDLEPTEGDPTYHIQGDVMDVLSRGWDMVIAFPPCTYLTKSNAWRWDAIADQRAEALEFVRTLMDAPAYRIAIENPSGAIGTGIRKADQYVQPWHFGQPYQKMTGLWLKNLPTLVPDVQVKPDDVVPWVQSGYGPRNANGKRTSGGVVRKAVDRNRTFEGIADAMARQWSTDISGRGW